MEGRSGLVLLERWLQKVCLDYRLHVVDGVYIVDCLFFKPAERFWLANRVQTNAGRWGFKREKWDHGQITVLSREGYLRGPTPRVSGMVAKLLEKAYSRAVDRVVGQEAWAALPPGPPLRPGKRWSAEEWMERKRQRRA